MVKKGLFMSIKNRVLVVFIMLSFCSALRASPKVALSSPYWGFENTAEGNVLKKDLTVSNTGDELLVLNIRSSCECVTLNNASFSLKPGAEKKLVVTFNTKGANSKTTEYVFIDSNDPENTAISWIIEGQVASSNNSSEVVRQVLASPRATYLPKIEIYSTKHCAYCADLNNKILPDLLKITGKKAEITFYPLEDQDNYRRLVFIENKLGKRNSNLPVIVINERLFGGKSAIEKELKQEILKLSDYAPSRGITVDKASAAQAVNERISSVKLAPVLAAAVIDGINPCAFAGIVFLVAYLGMIQKKKMPEIILTGALYIFAVFIVYFLIGLGLLSIMDFLVKFRVGAKIVYVSAAVITAVFSVLSFYDYYKLTYNETSSSSDVVLQLPKPIKLMMSRITSSLGSSVFFIPFGFLLGAVISLLEFFCTGQIYLPTIIYMVKIPALKVTAVALLFLYSLVFVVPLAVIFVVLLLTVNTGRIKAMDRKYVRLIKLFTGLLFASFSAIMFML